MDLSDTLVTTRKITATLSLDEIKTAAINAVRGKAGITPALETTAEAEIAEDGSVHVVIMAIVPDAATPVDGAPQAVEPPAAPPLAPVLNL